MYELCSERKSLILSEQLSTVTRHQKGSPRHLKYICTNNLIPHDAWWNNYKSLDKNCLLLIKALLSGFYLTDRKKKKKKKKKVTEEEDFRTGKLMNL